MNIKEFIKMVKLINLTKEKVRIFTEKRQREREEGETKTQGEREREKESGD